MRILAHLNNQYGGKIAKEISYWKTFEEAKRELYYVEYEGAYYEWVSYDTGYGGFDYIANYGKTSSIPGYARPYKIQSEYGWNPIRCECGAEKVNHSGHSYWCPKFKPY